VKSVWKALALLMGIGLAVAIGEILVVSLVSKRVLTHSELASRVGAQYQVSSINPFTVRPNFKGRAPSMEFPGQMVRIRTNSFGFRSPEIEFEKPEGVKRILFLGDSYTFGLFVNNEETYPAKVGEALQHRQRRVEILNAGYTSGWETDHHYNWLVNRGLDFDPDIVIQGFFTGNDIMNLRPDQWTETDERGLPIKIVDPLVYVDLVGRLRRTEAYKNDEIREIEIVKRTVGDQFIYRIPLLRESKFLVYVGVTIENLLMKATRMPSEETDRTHVYPHIFKKSDERFDQKEEIFLKLVKGISEITAERGIHYLVLMIPFNFQANPIHLRSIFPELRKKRRPRRAIVRDYFAELGPKLDAMGIPYLNALQLMRDSPGRYYPRNAEVHFNPAGHALVGKHLAEKIEALGWLDE
jgi:lysophospholipase L1-like esterase